MKIDQNAINLSSLNTAEKVALINELLVDVVADESSQPVSKELAELLDRRIAEYEANPDDVYSLDEVMSVLKQDSEG